MTEEYNSRPTFDVDDPRITARIEAKEKGKLESDRSRLIESIYELMDDLASCYDDSNQAAKLLNQRISQDLSLLEMDSLNSIQKYLVSFYGQQIIAYRKRKHYGIPNNVSLLEIALGSHSDTIKLAEKLNSGRKKRLPSLADYDHDPSFLFGEKSDYKKE